MLSFYLLHRTDDVAVYIVDQTGTIIRTVASGRHMRRGVRTPDGVFYWNGRRDDGVGGPGRDLLLPRRALAPRPHDRVDERAVVVQTVPPRPVVTSVTPSLIPLGLTPVKIEYRGTERRGGTVQIYRTDLPGAPRLVKHFGTRWNGGATTWDGQDPPTPRACRHLPRRARGHRQGLQHRQFPPGDPAAARFHAACGGEVRYLAAQPPLDPVPAGSDALVFVDSASNRSPGRCVEPVPELWPGTALRALPNFAFAFPPSAPGCMSCRCARELTGPRSRWSFPPLAVPACWWCSRRSPGRGRTRLTTMATGCPTPWMPAPDRTGPSPGGWPSGGILR